MFIYCDWVIAFVIRFEDRQQMGVPQANDWPTPQSPTLQGIIDALRRRSKAIKGRISTGTFDISLTDEEVNGERFERLSLDLKLYTGADQYSYVALSFWNDSVMHLSIQRASTGRFGWDYNYRRFGDFTNVSSKEMAELIESTVSTFDLMPDTIEKMWFACNLTHDDGFVDG